MIFPPMFFDKSHHFIMIQLMCDLPSCLKHGVDDHVDSMVAATDIVLLFVDVTGVLLVVDFEHVEFVVFVLVKVDSRGAFSTWTLEERRL